ncbi:nuclear transport factor 2 family protein [Rubripirellula sp.]|nr:nuclear transport factor 2 family protein [Rubripirellula sp.]MDB4749601.1 nuclear transport factor 2 family protein [Rubripirellula sp.]
MNFKASHPGLIWPTSFLSPKVGCLLIMTGMIMGNFSIAAAQENDAATKPSPLYVFRFIEVEPENVADWKQAVKVKQQKFNTGKDSSQWGTWRILTGPRSNQFARGFATTRELYTNPIHPVQGIAGSWEMPEASYWLEHVSPLQKNSGNQQIWRPIEGLFSKGMSHAEQSRFAQHRRWRMKPGMYQRLEANYKKLIAAFDHLQQPVDFSIARLEDGGDFMIYAETLAYNDTADMPGVGRVRKAFIELHGEGEWEKYLQEHNAVMQENAIVETETWMYEPDLSNLATMPGSEHAKAKVQEHINRVVAAFEKQDIDALMDEFVDGGIRSVSMSRGPAQGNKAVKKSLMQSFKGDATPDNSTLVGEILDARFIDQNTILAHGNFTVTNEDGVVVRSGKWGDVLRMEDGNAKFLLQSAYAERLDSMAAPTFAVSEAADEQKKQTDFKKIHRSIQRFTDAYNRGDVSALTEEFTKDAVRVVSGLSGVHVGHDAIRKSFESKWSGEVDIASGSVLKARVLHTTPINSNLVGGAGIWWLTSSDGKVIDGGYWGNVFRTHGDEVKLLLECAGSQSVAN